MRFYFTAIAVLIIASCGTMQDDDAALLIKPKIVEANGHVVSMDSMDAPVYIPVNENKLKKNQAGLPKIIPSNTHVFSVGKPIIKDAGVPIIYIPGQDTFATPKIVAAIESPFMAGIPEVVIANDAYVKDQNPQNFSIFRKLQGLKHDVVRCMLQDKRGNLWFGSDGGVSKFDGKAFTHFTEKQGLSRNIIYSMLEDKSGNLWFGTNGGGVSKYDGKHFTHYTKREGLNNDVVLSIAEDAAGNLWFGTEGGVSKFDGRQFTQFTAREGLCNNNVWSIAKDQKGNLWFGTVGGGISKYDGKSFTNYAVKDGLNHDIVLSILEDHRGNLWFGTYGGGISKYDGKSFIHYTEEQGLSNNSIFSIKEDRQGKLWIGTDGGVSTFDGNVFTHYTEKQGLSNNTVHAILEDKSGNLWLGTMGGVSKYDGLRFTHYSEKEGLGNDGVFSISEDKNGNIWFGTFAGVSKYDGNNFIQYSQSEGLSNNVVWSIFEDRNGNMWFGTNGGGVTKFNGKTFTYYTVQDGLSDGNVRAILEDRFGNLWFGTNGGGVTKYDGRGFTQYTEKQGLSNNIVRTIFEDNKGFLWFGTDGGGVSKFDGRVFVHFTEKEGLSDNVKSIFQDRTGNIWFGTFGSGIAKYDGKFFTKLTEREGLSNDYVFSIFEDNKNNLCIGTRFGFNSISEQKINEFFEKLNSGSLSESDVFFKNYGYEDGFLGVGVNGGNTILQDRNGTIWIGANDRITAFHADAVTPDTIAPNIQITAIELFNEPIAWPLLLDEQDSILTLKNGMRIADYSFSNVSQWNSLPENLSLSYNNNYVTFKFNGITMNQPKRVKYQYKLLGMDEHWSGVTSRNEATYGNLPQGKYTFLVKSMNSEGVWSSPFQYTFTIRPPWWFTWWAYVAYIILACGTFITYVRWRERVLRARQKVLQTKVELATNVIRKQKEEVEKQKEVVEEQKHLFEEKNREILDSIEYAKRIQSAILPPQRIVKEFLKNSFILYLPKDIVAGDFYWVEPIDNVIFFAVCDCTGHGVPGAMVSVVCNNALSRAVNEFALRKPGEIFNQTRELVVENFAKSDDEVKDGMDASLCALDFQNNKLLWSGASNPIWIYRALEKRMEEIKADKQPIGKAYNPKPFTTHEVGLEVGDIIYLFTDGYADQFGGENNKKFTRARFRELLLSIAHLPMDEQRSRLHDHHKQYRGTQEQVDDICVIGVRV